MVVLAASDKAKVFIARSAAMVDLARVADSAAQGSSSVLICGEKGAGKRLLAERLHSKSPRSQKPFVRVNCAALERLSEREAEKALFARLKAADGGTLFLDEAGALPLALQARLLSALQDGECGGARLVSSSSEDLEKAAGEGKFLGALLQRLNVVALRIPPLRERREDILPLAEAFLKKFSDETKKNFAGFSERAQKEMLSSYWPGNVGELKNSVERSGLLGTPPLADFAQSGYVPQSGQTLKDAVNGFKKFYIERALQTSGAKQADVAAALGIQRTYLSRLMLELGIRQ